MNWLSIVNAVVSINALAAGLWLKEPGPLPVWADFALVKTAVFHPSGSVKPVRKGCPGEGTWHAWITHRLAPHDVFTKVGGEKVGAAIGKLLDCHTTVEIDLEPLPSFGEEHATFFAGLRATLPPKFALRLAVPFTWGREDAARALAIVDGLDFMVYDTDARTAAEYEAVVKTTLALAKDFPGKILVGLPAYTHGVKGRHRPKIENLTAATRVWTCGPDFAVYAGWTMTEEESRQAAALVKKCHP